MRNASYESYFVFKEVKFNNTPEAMVYANILKLGHDTDKSTVTLLKDFADFEIRVYKCQLPDVTNANQRVALQNAINAIERYKSFLDGVVQRRDLRTNYIKNLLNYSELVKESYDYCQNAIRKQPEMNFFVIRDGASGI